MPIISITGFEGYTENILKLLEESKIWVASVKSLEIGAKNVTPFYIPSVQEAPGKHVVFCVQELFEFSTTGTPRTTEIRKELIRSIKIGFDNFLTNRKNIIKPESVTIIIRMVNREKGEYYNWKIHE